MYALDAMTGQQIWKLTNGNFHSGTPSVYNGMVYICGIDGLYALDQKTGIQKWKYPITALYAFSEFTPSTVVANNTVYICAWDGFVYALNATDGSLKWKTQSSGGAPFYSSVTLNNNLLYAGCSDSWLYALNISNGSVNWKFQTGDVIYKNPLVVNNNVFTSGLNGNQYMLNGATGAVIWSILNDLSICSPTFSNGVIYSGDGTNANGYDINTGNKVWSLGSGTGSGWSSPCVLNGKFYAGSSTPKFYAYDINSKAVIWSISTNAYNVNSSPVIANDIYYIGGNGQDFYAVDAATGTIKWFLPLSNPVYGSPCVIDQNGIKNYPGVSGEKN